jgi:hypothetical protein
MSTPTHIPGPYLVTRAHRGQRAVDFKQLGTLIFARVANDQGLDAEWVYQMWEAAWKRGYIPGVAQGPDHINAEQFDEAFRAIRFVHDDDGIEAPSPKCVRKAKNLAQRIEVATANGPSKTQRAITDICA